MHTPSFCPNPSCRHHWYTHTPRRTVPPRSRWWVHDGSYKSARRGAVSRFRCKSCGRHFSESTFDLHYYAKKTVDLRRLRRLLVSGCSIRAAARTLFVSPTTISHKIMLLARQSIASHADLTDDTVPSEHLVADGFQSFWVSQYHPNNFNLLAGADSQYLYEMSSVTLRRAGRMTPQQLARRALIEQRDPPEPGAFERSFQELLLEGERLWYRMDPTDRVLRTDQHQTYPRCVRKCSVSGIRHITVSSREPRTVMNPLFSVNYLDREIRKDLAEHHRETTCFARSAVMSVARMWVYLVWHNIDKPYRISPRRVQSHAEMAGIDRREVRRVRRKLMTERAFFSRSRLNHGLRRVWMGMIATPEADNRTNRRVTPRYCTC